MAACKLCGTQVGCGCSLIKGMCKDCAAKEEAKLEQANKVLNNTIKR